METPKYILLAVGPCKHATTVVSRTLPLPKGSGAHVSFGWSRPAGRVPRYLRLSASRVPLSRGDPKTKTLELSLSEHSSRLLPNFHWLDQLSKNRGRNSLEVTVFWQIREHRHPISRGFPSRTISRLLLMHRNFVGPLSCLHRRLDERRLRFYLLLEHFPCYTSANEITLNWVSIWTVFAVSHGSAGLQNSAQARHLWQEVFQ